MTYRELILTLRTICSLSFFFSLVLLFICFLWDISILSWNVRGANNRSARRHIRDLLLKVHPTIVIIMETHIAFQRTIDFWNREGYCEVAIVEAQGQVGGLWVLHQSGHQRAISVLDVTPNMITFKLMLGGVVWVCTGLYASPIPANCPQIWQSLSNLHASLDDPQLLIRDFNEIILPSEQNGGTFYAGQS